MYGKPFKSLLYIPYKNRFDIVKSLFINNTIHYCVNDIAPYCYIPNSTYIWNHKNGEYDQYQPYTEWLSNIGKPCNLEQFSIHDFKNI